MNIYFCGFSISNWQLIEKSGGKVIKAGSLWIEYLSEEEILGLNNSGH